MFPIKYIDNNLVWNKDNEVFAYYELIPRFEANENPHQPEFQRDGGENVQK